MEWAWIGTAIAGIAALIGGLFTNGANKKIASQNIAFQQQENELTRQREDNATQRRALDLQKAGLSQTLAAGSPASAASMVAPLNVYKPQSVIERVANAMNISNQVMAIKQQSANIRKTEAETTKALSEAQGQNLDNEHYLENFAMKKKGSEVEYHYKQAMTSLVDNQSKLAKIDGDYRAKILSAELRERLSRVRLNLSDAFMSDKQREKISQDIVESMARVNHLDKQDLKLLMDIGKDILTIRDMNHNYGLARTWNLPVGQQTQGYLGGIANLSRTFAGETIQSFGGIANWGNPFRYDSSGNLSYSRPEIETKVYTAALKAIKNLLY